MEVDPASRFSVGPIVERGDDDGAADVQLHCGGGRTVSETVLYPILPSQKQGIEDVRLTRLRDEDGGVTYHGTFTAFSGSEARPGLLSGTIPQLNDAPARRRSGEGKGHGAVPAPGRRRYAMLGRQDENIWPIYSHDLLRWDGGDKLLAPPRGRRCRSAIAGRSNSTKAGWC